MRQQKEFCIIRFDADQIIMKNKKSGKLYDYQEGIKEKKVINNYPHQLEKINISTGVLYERSLTNLQKQLQKKRKSSKKEHYSQQELINTFLPILQALQYIHKNEQIHGDLTPKSIVINTEGEVCLKDSQLVTKNNVYYQNSDIGLKEDYYALGLILLECTTLLTLQEIKQKNVNYILSQIMNSKNKDFVTALYIMLNKIQCSFNSIPLLLKKQIKLKEKIKLNSLIKNFQFLSLPTRYDLNQNKQIERKQDSQNSKFLTTGTKRKIADKILKFRQKSMNQNQQFAVTLKPHHQQIKGEQNNLKQPETPKQKQTSQKDIKKSITLKWNKEPNLKIFSSIGKKRTSVHKRNW